MATMPMLVRMVLMVTAAFVAYRTMAWSLDSPVLRRAFRNRPCGYGTKMALLGLLALTIRFMRMYGDGFFSAATIVSGMFFFLAGTMILLFTQLIALDLREVFLLVAQRFGVDLPEDETEDDQLVLNCIPSSHRTCVSQTTCSATPQPCGARGLTNPWRPADLPRTRQHR